MAERAEHLAQLRRADSKLKASRLLAQLEAMVLAGEAPVVSVLARRAGVSRRFVYDHPELRAEIACRTLHLADLHAGAVVASGGIAASRSRELESEEPPAGNGPGELTPASKRSHGTRGAG